MQLELLNLDTILLAAAAKADIAGASADASALALDFAKGFWSNIFKAGLFGRICLAVKPILFAGVIYKGWQIMEETANQSSNLDTGKLIRSILSLLAIFIMINNSGVIAFNTVLGMRNYTSTISDTLLKGISADFQAFSPLNQLSKNINSKPILQAFQTELRTCAAIKAKSPNCVSTAITNLETNLNKQNITAVDDPNLFSQIATLKADAIAAEANTQTAAQDKNPLQQGLDFVANATDLGNVFQHLVEVLLIGVSFGFFLALELTLLIFGLLFPINLTLSLFDPSPLTTWIGGFWTLTNAKLCFSIIIGIIVQLQAWMESKNGNPGLFVIELLMAVFAPVLTFFYCQNTALALAGAMSSLTNAPMRGAGAGAVKGGQAALKGAGAGIGKAITSFKKSRAAKNHFK